jgi:hypothetical protein
MPFLDPGVAAGITEGLGTYQTRQMNEQVMRMRQQEMEQRALQLEQDRMAQAQAQRAREADAALWRQRGPMPPPPGQPSAPATPPQPPGPPQGMAPAGGGQPMPPMVPSAQAGMLVPPQQQGPQPIPPYQTVQSAGQQRPPQMQQPGAPMGPPPVQPQQPPSQGISLDSLIGQLQTSGVDPSLWTGVIRSRLPLIQEADRARAAQLAQRKLDDAESRQPPQTRKVIQGEREVQQEWDPKTRTWADIGTGPRFAKQVQTPGSTLPALDKETIDFYAKQSLAGDNSWQVGLARGKVGQQLISAVKDRIPQLAKETGVTAEGAIANKAELVATQAALRDRQKFVAASNQFVRNMNSQMDLVEKYIKPGVAGSVPVINKWIQSGRVAMAGDPDVSALDTAIRGLAREHQRIVTGVTSNAQLHASAQATADQLLNRAQTADQMRAVIKVMREEAENARRSGEMEVESLKARIGGGKAAPTSDTGGKVVDWSELK